MPKQYLMPTLYHRTTNLLLKPTVARQQKLTIQKIYRSLTGSQVQTACGFKRPSSHFSQSVRVLSSSIGVGTTCTPQKAVAGIQHSVYDPISVPESTCFTSFVLSKFETFKTRIAIENGVTGEKFTYDEVISKTLKIASGLTKCGYKSGDIIAIYSTNNPEYLLVFLAASAIGVTVTTINPGYTAQELNLHLQDSQCCAIITLPELVSVVKEALASSSNQKIKEILVFGNFDGCRPFSSLMEDDGSAFSEFAPCNTLEDILVLPYSSGTTGLPKGVMLTHHNVIANLLQISILDMTQNERVVGVLPFFHIYGMVVILFNCTINGGHIITMPKFEPQHFLSILQNKKITTAHLVPPIILFLAKHPMVQDYDLSTIRRLVSGAAPLGKDLSIECSERLCIENIIQGYGMTETSPVCHMDIPPVRYSSIGTLVPNTEAKIIVPETNKVLGPMEIGELCVRGPQVMKGYFNRPEATAETLKGDWLHTGDVAYYDDDGYFFITERLKELIKYKGFQVPPAELESLLLSHPDIQDCAVIGIPDVYAGEVPRAYLVCKANKTLSDTDIFYFLEDKIASHKKLRGGVEFVSEIPKSAAGKILRRVLKAEYLSNSK